MRTLNEDVFSILITQNFTAKSEHIISDLTVTGDEADHTLCRINLIALPICFPAEVKLSEKYLIYHAGLFLGQNYG